MKPLPTKVNVTKLALSSSNVVSLRSGQTQSATSGISSTKDFGIRTTSRTPNSYIVSLNEPREEKLKDKIAK